MADFLGWVLFWNAGLRMPYCVSTRVREGRQVSITKTEYCMHSQHFVESEKITWIYLENGGRRRICEDCKLKVEKNKKTAKKQLTTS